MKRQGSLFVGIFVVVVAISIVAFFVLRNSNNNNDVSSTSSHSDKNVRMNTPPPPPAQYRQNTATYDAYIFVNGRKIGVRDGDLIPATISGEYSRVPTVNSPSAKVWIAWSFPEAIKTKNGSGINHRELESPAYQSAHFGCVVENSTFWHKSVSGEPVTGSIVVSIKN